MSSTTDPEPTSSEVRLGELVDQFQERRAQDASVGIGAMRDEAGDLFPELAGLAECLGILRAGFGETEEEIPAAFGPYRILSQLGSGVSGVVYEAEGDGKKVALKVMRESLALSPDALQRFRREIDVARRLEHPNIVRVLDHGEVDGRLFLAMELVDGYSLSELLDLVEAQGGTEPTAKWLAVLDACGVPPLATGAPPAEAYARRMAALFAPVARALAHAEQMDLIHRDLKPGNLLLACDGRLRITDFGLAKVVGEEITSTIAVLGTPGFMSPEQASGESRRVDARSDIYGLGATLYQALTLKYPVEAESFSEILAAIMTKRPEPLSAAYPRGLDLLLSRCLEKDPDDRYPDANTLAGDLDRVARGKPPRIGRVSFLRRTRRYLVRHQQEAAVVAGVVLVAVVVGLWWFTRPGFLEVEIFPGGEVTLNGDPLGAATWSGEIDRGDYTLVARRERFEEYVKRFSLGPGGQRSITYHLRPKDPFDLALLAEAYGVSVQEPVVVRSRGLSDEPIGKELELSDPKAFAQRLAQFEAPIRDRPYVQLFAIDQLLQDGLFPEAYAAARALAEKHPDEPVPVQYALEALRRLGLDDRPLYRDLLRWWEEVSRG
ncbi:MAG: serine/threonine-protein kinase [Planctomycetota bacterium]|jgi:serine/threonine protein kinase